MASPTLVRGAVILSVAGTTAAALYIASSGGDKDELVVKTDQAISWIRNKGEEARSLDVNAMISDAQARMKSLSNTLTSTTPMQKEREEATIANDKGNKTTLIIDKERDLSNPHAETPSKDTRIDFCHTCSGPRIWYFAERLNLTPRLKRRFTPYPDPVPEEQQARTSRA